VENVADQQRAELLEQQDQREGEQDLIEMLAIVEITEQKALEEQAEGNADQDRDRQCQPQRSSGPHDQERRIRAHHEQTAVGQIDHAQHAEDERQAASDEKQQQPVLKSIQQLSDE